MISEIIGKKKKIESYYDEWHKLHGIGAWREEGAYKYFIDILPYRNDAKLLDVGCGTGYLLKWASKKGYNVYGIDISYEALEITRKNVPSAKLYQMNAERLELPLGYFDFVTSIGVIEHFVNIEEGLRHIRQVAKADALFLLVMPNLNYIGWKNKVRKGTHQADINEQPGFVALKIYKDPFIWKKVDIFGDLRPSRVLKRLLYKIYMYLLPLRHTYQFVFLCRKATEKV